MEVLFPKFPLHNVDGFPMKLVEDRLRETIKDPHRGDFVTFEDYLARYAVTLQGVKVPKGIHYITIFGDDRPGPTVPPEVPNAKAQPATPPDLAAAAAIRPSGLTGDDRDSEDDPENMERDKRQGITGGS